MNTPPQLVSALRSIKGMNEHLVAWCMESLGEDV